MKRRSIQRVSPGFADGRGFLYDHKKRRLLIGCDPELVISSRCGDINLVKNGLVQS